ncbi:MAG: hypothetical protein WC828_06620 [Thermoleophilia bacterium]|jgi:hypothetical protein
MNAGAVWRPLFVQKPDHSTELSGSVSTPKGFSASGIALGLEFRSPERTLTDEDVDGARAAILAELGEKLGATMRG